MALELLVALVVALTEVVKRTGTVEARYVPFVALVVGVLVAVLDGGTENLVAGLVAGATAAGTYDVVKSGYGLVKK